MSHEIGAVGGAGALYGLQARTGKRLWKRVFADLSDIAVQDPKANGVFVLRTRNNPKSNVIENVYLDYLTAANGKTQKTWMLPKNTNRIVTADDDLLVVDTNGLVKVYSCQKMLGTK